MTTNNNQPHWLTIIGIGEEGYDLLTNEAKQKIDTARLLLGSERQLKLIPEPDNPSTTREHWPSPMMPRIEQLLREKPESTVIIASGDPLCWGIGRHLTKHCTKSELKIIPSVSILSRIAAHMHWPTTDIVSLSLCSQPLSAIENFLTPATKLVLLSASENSPQQVARYLIDNAFGQSEITILENLGAQSETITKRTVKELAETDIEFSSLNSLAIELKLSITNTEKTDNHTPQPGLPDDAFDSDGQLTKRQIRAITLAHLRPKPGELLWDIGSGSGSIAIEWLRTNLSFAHSETSPTIISPVNAIGIEKDPERLERARTNAARLGVPKLTLIEATAPNGLKDLPAPDAIFIGGGTSNPKILEIALASLKTGGRIVANAVTIEGESSLIEAFKTHGGELNKISVSSAESLGRFKGWRPQMPITQWIYHKKDQH